MLSEDPTLFLASLAIDDNESNFGSNLLRWGSQRASQVSRETQHPGMKCSPVTECIEKSLMVYVARV